MTDVAVIVPSVPATPSTVTFLPLASEGQAPLRYAVPLVACTVRPPTTKRIDGQLPSSCEIDPDTVSDDVGAAPACTTVTVCPPTSSAPDRAAVDVFALTANAIVALPAPLSGEVTSIQETSADAVQSHDAADAVSDKLPVRPPAGASTAVGETVKVHGGAAAACVTVTAWPATVSVAVRGEASGLGAAEYCTLPLPVPLAPEVIVSQAALLDAVHVQVSPDAMSIDPVPPLAPTDSLVLDSEYVQGGGAAVPACVMVTF